MALVLDRRAVQRLAYLASAVTETSTGAMAAQRVWSGGKQTRACPAKIPPEPRTKRALRGCVTTGFHPHTNLPPHRRRELDSRLRGNDGWMAAHLSHTRLDALQ